MAAPGQRDSEREQFWRRTIEACARSGDTIRRFCADRGLNEPSFYAWRRELRRRDAERNVPTRVPNTGRRAAARFVPLTVKPPAPSSSIEIVRGGTTIRFPRDVDAGLLAGVLEAIGRFPC